jgi:hypothetical protein
VLQRHAGVWNWNRTHAPDLFCSDVACHGRCNDALAKLVVFAPVAQNMRTAFLTGVHRIRARQRFPEPLRVDVAPGQQTCTSQQRASRHGTETPNATYQRVLVLLDHGVKAVGSENDNVLLVERLASIILSSRQAVVYQWLC